MRDSLNYLLGKYISFAFNDVKHYPKKPFLENVPNTEQSDMDGDTMEKMARLNVLKLGGRIKNNDGRRT